MHFEASAEIRVPVDLQPSFERFVNGLKAHAEAG